MKVNREVPPGYRMILGRPVIIIALNDIILVEGVGNYCTVRFRDESRLIIAITLGKLAARLPELVRIHRKYLVNPHYVHRIDIRTIYARNSGQLTLHSGERLPIAKRRKMAVRIVLTAYKITLLKQTNE